MSFASLASRSHRSLLAAGLLALAAAPAAWAQASGPGLTGRPYIGGSIGSPDWRGDQTVNGITRDSSGGTGLKLYGGYAFSDNFALELGAVRLGHMSGPAGEAKADGVYLDAVGLWPVAPQWSLLGRVGAVNAKVSTPTGSDRGTDLKFGAGVQYNLSSNVSIRGEWERYGLKAFDAKPKADLWTVGVNYAF